jgi:hypothetical protein
MTCLVKNAIAQELMDAPSSASAIVFATGDILMHMDSQQESDRELFSLRLGPFTA